MIVIAAAYAAMGLTLAGLTAYAWAGLLRRDGRILTRRERARWAWRCRGNPAMPAHETITEPEAAG